MFETIERVIDEGDFVLNEMLSKIDYFFAKGVLTEEEHQTLVKRARSHAKPSKEADLFAKLQELEARVKALEEKSDTKGEEETNAEDFVVGKWYYNGNKCLWEGKVYTCIAPEGTVCVWSPTDYPAYWIKK